MNSLLAAVLGVGDIGGKLPPPSQEVIAAINAAPLGSAENPIRAGGPAGQRAYLDRLRCPNGKPPHYKRIGNFGIGPYGTIIDGYSVICEKKQMVDSYPDMKTAVKDALRPNTQNKSTTLYLDMYHPDITEERAPEGFMIVN